MAPWQRASVIFPVTVFLVLTAALGVWSAHEYSWNQWAPATCRPDSCFCEAIGSGTVVQPSNAWSSLAFVLVGLLIAHNTAKPSGREYTNRMACEPAYRRLYGYALVAIGLGSYFYHSSLSFAGQVCDMSGMYWLITFALLYGVARSLALRPTMVVTAYLVLNTALLGFQVAFPDLRRYVFGLLLLVLVGIEIRHYRGPGVVIQNKWLWRAVGTMALAFVVWVLDKTKLTCSPSSIVQGHAIWHLLSATAGWCLYRYYRSEAAPVLR
jgi:dihydroceramidase